MNNILRITLPDKPMAKQRSRNRADGKGHYNPQSLEMRITKQFIKNQVPLNFKMIEKNIPIVINITWFIKPSKTASTKKFIDLIKNEDIPHLIKPDRDNLDKYVLDCMTGIVFADDCQVYDGRISKYWSVYPRTEIEVIF